jgi:hypothetical protein
LRGPSPLAAGIYDEGWNGKGTDKRIQRIVPSEITFIAGGTVNEAIAWRLIFVGGSHPLNPFLPCRFRSLHNVVDASISWVRESGAAERT